MRDDSGAFLSVSTNVYRWDRGSRAMTRVATPSSYGAKSLQATAAHLFYLEGDQIMRVGRDGKGLTRIERDPLSRARLLLLPRQLRHHLARGPDRVLALPCIVGQEHLLEQRREERRERAVAEIRRDLREREQVA